MASKVTLDKFYKVFIEFTKLQEKRWVGNEKRWVGNEKRWDGNEKRWVGNEKRWDGNEKRWSSNEKRWEENEKKLVLIIKEVKKNKKRFDDLTNFLDKEVMADRKRIESLES